MGNAFLVTGYTFVGSARWRPRRKGRTGSKTRIVSQDSAGSPQLLSMILLVKLLSQCCSSYADASPMGQSNQVTTMKLIQCIYFLLRPPRRRILLLSHVSCAKAKRELVPNISHMSMLVFSSSTFYLLRFLLSPYSLRQILGNLSLNKALSIVRFALEYLLELKLTEYSTCFRPLRYSNSSQNHEWQLLRLKLSFDISVKLCTSSED